MQVLLGQLTDAPGWERALAADGLMATYRRLFGDPFVDAVEPLVPTPLEQPPLGLPFADDETWYYTGGPHGGWGRGSAWAAVDFAPPDDLALVNSACYVSQYWATAVADGVIARAEDGAVILDLDGDGDESTGWTILYLHLATDGRIATGSTVRAGDRLGRPSCEGGFSNGTHLHIARRYNGEWIPADCEGCNREPRPLFVMDTWVVDGLPEQEYQGFMRRPDRWIVAEQYRDVSDNRVSSGEVPLR
jgi:murein DD-endopeptidase MepM/ murein hydrolase activator NlpD